MERASDPSLVRGRWKKYGLPESLDGKSFLDVGCWGGGFCYEAACRGADKVLGIDYVPSFNWETNAQEEIDFLIMDVFSPNFLALPIFDVVLCLGVLYHVSDPVGLLRRLHMKTKELLVLETVISNRRADAPILEYCLNDSFDNNSSNWFLPNMFFLNAICEEVGFIVEKIISSGDRVCLYLKPFHKMTDKLLPRKPQYMKS
jgi:tRNA (mo5U34)-methyltransferase